MIKESKRTLVFLVVLFAVLLAAELVLSNFTALTVLGKEAYSLPLDGALLSGSMSEKSGGIQVGNTGHIKFFDLGLPVRTVSVRMSSDSMQSGKIIISLLDESAAENYHVFTTGRYYTRGTYVYRIRSSGECKTLRMEFTGNGECLLEDVTVNAAPAFSFSVLRFLLMYGLCALFYFVREKQWWTRFFQWKGEVLPDGNRNSEDGSSLPRTLSLLLLLFSGLFIALTIHGIGFIPMPLADVGTKDAYAQLFSSLLNGRLDLDVPVDPALLESLNNPYDVTERTAMLKGIGAIWDRAYFEGHFYCYFGIAPIFAVYFPVYLITGFRYIPTTGTATLVLLLFALFGIHSALNAASKIFHIRKPAFLYLLSMPACALGFLLPVLGSSADMYYLPVASAYCFLAWTLASGFGAFLKQKVFLRRLFLCLSGFFLASAFASRPTVALSGILLIPLFVSWISKEKKSWWKEAICFCIPLFAGVGFIFWYNYARFGSPLDFGASYQMTVHDIRSNGISFSLLGESLVHYFLQSPAYSGLFPYYGPSRLDLASYGVYFYSTWNIGAFHLPLTVFPFLGWLPKKKDPVRTATVLIAALLSVALAFIDLCLAGACIRYLFDILFPLMFAGILMLWEWGESISSSVSGKAGFRLTAVLALPLLLTCAAGFALTFANERNWVLSGNPYVFRFFEQLFSIR